MLTGAQNSELYSEWAAFIQSAQTREAFNFIVGLAASSKKFNCHIQWKGDNVRDFRLHDAKGEQPYSFITNQQWLLFYFWPPAVRAGIPSRERLAQDFDSFNENPKGEWTVKIRSIDDVKRLLHHVPIVDHDA
jgi:hypothetical protein